MNEEPALETKGEADMNAGASGERTEMALESPNDGKVANTAGQEMKALRHRLGWTQRQLADYLHVHKLTVSGWELGRHPISRPAGVLLGQLGKRIARRGKSQADVTAPNPPMPSPESAGPAA